jgi:hypothetical protein
MYSKTKLLERTKNASTKLLMLLMLACRDWLEGGGGAHRNGLQKFNTYCMGIQKHFMEAEIPRYDLPYRFSGLSKSFFSRNRSGKLIFNKVK